ncbi:hypothetical protein Tco_1285456 [Tanacetum coccineum]
MLLLAKAITQNFSNPTNNHLRASSNTRNQAIIQGDMVNIQSRNSGNTGRNSRRAYVQEEVVEGMNAPKEDKKCSKDSFPITLHLLAILQLFNATTASGKGHYLGIEEAGVNLTDEQNDFSCWTKHQRMEEIEELMCKHILNGQNSHQLNILVDDGQAMRLQFYKSFCGGLLTVLYQDAYDRVIRITMRKFLKKFMGLGHNLFSVGQFCDRDLEVAFRSNTCYIRNLEGDDLLTGGRESNLYTISISDMAASSPVCLMSKATSTKS